MWPKETHRRPEETPPRTDPPSTEIAHHRPKRKGTGDSSRTCLPGVTGNKRGASTRSGNATATNLERLRRSGEPPLRAEPPPDRDRAPQPRAHEHRRHYADLLARRNGEYMRSLHALRERDRQLAGETTEVTVGSAGEVNPKSLDVEVETQRSLVGDGRIIQDR